MVNSKIAVLLSTYNGERYLSQQIESIINQDYNNWELYIRDDGSTDNTHKIINDYAEKFSNIHFINKGHVKNIGVVKSFLSLLASTNADFYMFADQDDYWKSDKITKTLNVMTNESDCHVIPICVHTDLQIVDSNLKGNATMNGNNVWHDFLRLMFGNCVTGCTMMINEPLKKLVKFDQVDQIYMHDWWIALIAANFGKILYLNEPTILYRQHMDNVVGEAEKSKVKRFFNKKMDIENMLNVFSISNRFKAVYGDQLNGKNRKYIFAYSNLISESNLWNNLIFVFHFPPKRKTLLGKMFFSYLVVKNHDAINNIKRNHN